MEDFAGAVEWTCRERGVEKILLIGHSIGGQHDRPHQRRDEPSQPQEFSAGLTG